MQWHIITGEYPPQSGGVSDYTRQVAEGLTDRGEEVHIWAPPCELPDVEASGIEIHRLPDRFGRRGLRMLGQALRAVPQARRILVQYVPHAFGWRAMNLPFCVWLFGRRSESVWVMFHEVAVPFRRKPPFRHNIIALINRIMAFLTARSAERIFVSIPAWKPKVTPLARRGTPIDWLPIPTTIPVVDGEPDAARFAFGHFSSYGPEVSGALRAVLLPLLIQGSERCLLMGNGSIEFLRQLIASHPDLGDRVCATGELRFDEISRLLEGCALMLQPYPDGVSTRRTTIMASLSHGRPVLTTIGPATEPFWSETRIVALEPASDPAAFVARSRALLASPAERETMGEAAALYYARHFNLCRTIETLLGSSMIHLPLQGTPERAIHADAP